MILDIRGTHGSGKSWIPRQLIERYSYEPILEDSKLLGYHLEEIDTGVVGKYTDTGGGCDGVPNADEVVRRVKLFAKKYKHVVFEGILVAHTFKRYSALATELKNYDYVFAFLDTPLATCIERVKSRRLIVGDTRPLNPRNIIRDWSTIWERVRNHCINANHKVIVLPHLKPLRIVLELLRGKSK